jgi:hypothetical protein
MLIGLSACGSSAGSTDSESARVAAPRPDTETSGPTARASEGTLKLPNGEVARPGAISSPRAVSATAPSGEVAQPAASSSAREVSPTGPSSRAVSAAQALAEVRALVDRGRIGAARALAEHHLQALPLESPEARQIMSLTGVHPHP